MPGTENELSIRSHHGMLRDLIPIYSLNQILPNLVVLGFLLWLGRASGHLASFSILVVMVGWVLQFVSRPSVMTISEEQAVWLEAVLKAQGFFTQSASDGRWRVAYRQWWQRWPHLSIAFVPGDGVTVIAPRDVMESLRANLEVLEKDALASFAQGERQLDYQPAEPEQLPWTMKVPSLLLGAICVLAWIWHFIVSGKAGMGDWGISGAALCQGRFETIFLHMFAHGSAMHLAMNMTALAAIGGTLTARLGPTPLNWLRFLLLFILSGLAGAALYLALHPAGAVPMLGASGALYGLIGLLIRAPADGGPLLSLRSSTIRRTGWDLIKQNAFLFALLALMSWSSGTAGGLAWEAHLGGFLFGLFVGPKFLGRSAMSGEPETETVASNQVATDPA